MAGKAERLRHLISANQSLAEIESLPVLLDRLLELAQDVTGAEASSVLLWDSARDLLSFAHARNSVLGDAASDLLRRNITLRLGEGVAGWVAKERTSLIVREAQSDDRFSSNADRSTGFITRCLLCVPVLYGEELLGVLQVLNATGRDCFDKTDQELLESFAHLAAVAIVRSRLLAARLEQQRLHTQLETAARIQSHFWPRLPDPGHGSRLWAMSEPATFVGGDLYDCITLPDGSLLLYVADVAGKGLPAALVMAALWSRIRSESQAHDRLSGLMGAVNDALAELFGGDMFVTAIIGRYDPATGRLRFASAGHLPPVWVRDGKLLPPPATKGMPLGIVAGLAYEEQEVVLAPGDAVLFLTDGVTEARDGAGELFDDAGVARTLAGTMARPCGPQLVKAVAAWQKGVAAADDMTIFEIWREPGDG